MSVVLGEVFFHSGNFHGPLFVFITVCEFDNTDTEGASSIEWRHVSGVRRRRSVNWCLKSVNHLHQ